MSPLTTQHKPVTLTRSFFALLFVSALGSAPVAAQTTWIESTRDGPQVSVEWTKPSFDGETSTSFLTSRLLLSGQYPVSDATRLEADIPLAHYGSEEGNVSSTKLGNPYLGVRHHFGRKGAVGGGVRLPLADIGESGSLSQGLVDALAFTTGSYADPNRTESFFPDVLTTRTYLERTFWLGPDFALRFRPGLSVLVPTSENGGDVEAILDYGGHAWYEGSQLRAGLGITGRTNFTENAASSSDRSLYTLDAAVQRPFGRIRPGLVVRVPLNEEIASAVDYAVGATVSVGL